MSDIKISQRDVPLFEVVEHIAGDLGQAALQFRDITLEEAIGRPPPEDIGYEHMRAWWGDWETPLPVDSAIVQVWDRALADLIKAVKAGSLKVSSRASKSEDLKELRSGNFPTKAHNPFSELLDLDAEYSGERILEFGDGAARIVVRGKVLETDICADFWQEVLSLWPSQPPDTNDTGSTDLVEAMPVLQDAGPQLAVRKDGAPISRELTELEIDEMIRAAAKERGGDISQNDAEKIVRNRLQGMPMRGLRKKVRESVKRIFGNRNSGPRGPRKNCAS